MPGAGKVERRRRRVAIYHAIVEFWEKNNYPPSFEDIRIAAKVQSKTTVLDYVRELTELGYLTMTPGINRSITLTDKVL